MTESITEEILRGLRAACWAGDGPGLVALLPGLPLTEVLQFVGDALLGAAADGVPGAAEAAERCLALLEERGWDGDEELASQFEGALGQGPVPLLRPLTVDLEELSGLLEDDPLSGGGRIDLTTGECWPEQVDIDEDDEEDDGLGRWLPVPCEGSRDGYRDMELFITTVADAGFADRLEIAISGRGAFRRFKDVLARSEDEYSRYHRFSGERQRGRARAWLAGQGYRPVGRR